MCATQICNQFWLWYWKEQMNACMSEALNKTTAGPCKKRSSEGSIPQKTFGPYYWGAQHSPEVSWFSTSRLVNGESSNWFSVSIVDWFSFSSSVTNCSSFIGLQTLSKNVAMFSSASSFSTNPAIKCWKDGMDYFPLSVASNIYSDLYGL